MWSDTTQRRVQGSEPEDGEIGEPGLPFPYGSVRLDAEPSWVAEHVEDQVSFSHHGGSNHNIHSAKWERVDLASLRFESHPRINSAD